MPSCAGQLQADAPDSVPLGCCRLESFCSNPLRPKKLVLFSTCAVKEGIHPTPVKQTPGQAPCDLQRGMTLCLECREYQTFLQDALASLLFGGKAEGHVRNPSSSRPSRASSDVPDDPSPEGQVPGSFPTIADCAVQLRWQGPKQAGYCPCTVASLWLVSAIFA